jgi:hypothetical protein
VDFGHVGTVPMQLPFRNLESVGVSY